MTPIRLCVTGQALIHGALSFSGPGCDAVRALMLDADLAFANLEGTIAVAGAWPTKTKTLHLADTEAIEALARLGLRALTHANNHAFDLGPPGIAATRAAVEGAGLALAGSGMDGRQAGMPAFVDTPSGRIAVLAVDLGPHPDMACAGDKRAGINALRMTREVGVPVSAFHALHEVAEQLGDLSREQARAAVGYRGALPGAGAFELFGTRIVTGAMHSSRWRPDEAQLASFKAGIQHARRSARAVAVALHNHHWDSDWSRTPDWLLDLAREFVDAGADLVAGTGAPVLQPLRFHKGRPILAGLGNLIFHTRRPDTYDREGVPVWSGAVCRCVLDPDGARVEILPVAVGRPGRDGETAPAPAALEGEAGDAVMARLTHGLGAAELARVTRLPG